MHLSAKEEKLSLIIPALEAEIRKIREALRDGKALDLAIFNEKAAEYQLTIAEDEVYTCMDCKEEFNPATTEHIFLNTMSISAVKPMGEAGKEIEIAPMIRRFAYCGECGKRYMEKTLSTR